MKTKTRNEKGRTAWRAMSGNKVRVALACIGALLICVPPSLTVQESPLAHAPWQRQWTFGQGLHAVGLFESPQVRMPRFRRRVAPTSTSPEEPPPPGETTYGPRATITCTTGVEITVGSNIQSVIDLQPAGTTYRLRTGTHRITSGITPKQGDTFCGEHPATISGGRVLTGWAQDGADWWVGGQTQGTDLGLSGQCFGPGVATGAGAIVEAYNFPRCRQPEDVFLDNAPLLHVASRSNLATGRYYFDYAADRIYMRDNPNGRVVETSVAPSAMVGSASNVTVRNISLEKFATNIQVSPVLGGSGWIFEYCRIRHVHGIGMRLAPNRIVRYCELNDNGQMGIGGTGSGSIVEFNEIARNNYSGTNYFFEAGGTKFTFTNGLTVRHNFIHHNFGNALWTDIDNINVLYEYNVVEDNRNIGIFHEISYACTIRNNTSRRNGTDHAYGGWVEGSGLILSSSRDCVVHDNTVEDNWQNLMLFDTNRGISPTFGSTYMNQNNVIRNNVVRVTTHPATNGGRIGGLQSGVDRLFNGTNTWRDNRYFLPPNGINYFVWQAGSLSDAQWLALPVVSGDTVTR